MFSSLSPSFLWEQVQNHWLCSHWAGLSFWHREVVLVAEVIEQQHSQAIGAYRAAMFFRNIRAFLASLTFDMFMAKTEPTVLKCIIRAA